MQSPKSSREITDVVSYFRFNYGIITKVLSAEEMQVGKGRREKIKEVK